MKLAFILGTRSKYIQLGQIGVEENSYLLTLHRAENVESPKKLKNIFYALSQVDEDIIFPIHPQTEKKIKSLKMRISKNIKVIKPLGYIEFFTLLYYSKKVLTDSGGVQKQAYFSQKPCITLRNETEWVGTAKVGANILVGSNVSKIKDGILNFNPPANSYNTKIFGDDRAAEKIVKYILNTYKNLGR